jgi:hypothetical protein
MARVPQTHVSVEDAREALEYWLRRVDRLPRRRRAARREARAMIARWERRHRDAVVARRSRTILGRIALEIGLQLLLEPPRAPGGPMTRRRRRKADLKLREQEIEELRRALHLG